MKKKRKKKKTKLKVVLTIALLLIIICVFYVYKLTSSYTHSEDRELFTGNNVFSFDCPEDYKYIHLKLKCNENSPIKYSVINPAGQVVKTDELVKDSDFSCDSKKGMWKVSFEVNKDVKIRYNLWEGNMKFLDPIQK